ncbi:radical SAM family heme chaperone HemW [Prochlorococcus sp. MIT 1307]|uniref:radical SAM family heme chaperone HemW n=1 Tax=Prochlorococcus sp. MIT 1307 TaxID=3096219 RepID=UPI002A761810|nr:radical SAM family heme chaperone HemW [Prochlorococcus sp. MIT 1307]
MGDVHFFNSPRSAYLHIPFCHRRCFYCDFAVVPLGDNASGANGPGSSSIKAYLSLLHREISLIPQGPPLATLYIGGGTPSLLTPSQISSLLKHLEAQFGFQYGAEISLEIDPASFSLNALEGYMEAGINRFSLGGQSFDDHSLELIGRRHRKHHLVQSCDWLNEFYKRGRILSWSLDLLQNLPGQDLAIWEKELKNAMDTGVPHLSIYDLSVEPGTVFARKKSRGELQLPNEDLSAEIMRCTSSVLGRAGFGRYEISNYAMPGHASRHNRVYWSGSGWWGFGQGATSAPWGERLSRPRTRDLYQRWIETQECFGLDSSLEANTAKSMALDEQFMVGLRRREGVDLMLLSKRWGWSNTQCLEYLNSLRLIWRHAIQSGWLISQGWRFKLSDPEGMEFSNQVLIQMLLWWDSLPEDAVAVPSFGELSQKVDDLRLMAG